MLTNKSRYGSSGGAFTISAIESSITGFKNTNFGDLSIRAQTDERLNKYYLLGDWLSMLVTIGPCRGGLTSQKVPTMATKIATSFKTMMRFCFIGSTFLLLEKQSAIGRQNVEK